MNEKKADVRKNVVYAEQEERVFTGNENGNINNDVIFQLKDLVSCLNFCDYEIDKIRKKISDKIHQLDNSDNGS